MELQSQAIRSMSTISSTVSTRPPLGCAAVMMEVLRGELRERELPFTHQREAIAQVLFESTRHLSADDVSATLKERGEGAGKATVYRTLALLVELGLATEHDFDEGFKRYEAHVGAAQHDHLICTACGRVASFQHPELDRVLAEVADQHGFDAITRQVKVFGTCSATRVCREVQQAHLAAGTTST
jgi:Fur family ferric uptake transcriptional regulator